MILRRIAALPGRRRCNARPRRPLRRPRPVPDVTRESDPIAWRDDYASALEEARTANRLLWIQFTGPWCPNCVRMERDSFPHPAVVEHARASFVPLKLAVGRARATGADFNLTALPATIIVSPDRAVIATHQGFLGPADFDAIPASNVWLSSRAVRQNLARRPTDRRAPAAPKERRPT